MKSSIQIHLNTNNRTIMRYFVLYIYIKDGGQIQFLNKSTNTYTFFTKKLNTNMYVICY